MAWHWNWSFFVITSMLFAALIALIRIKTNASYVEDFGLRADYKRALQTRPASFVIGVLGSGAFYATAVTAIAGFILASS